MLQGLTQLGCVHLLLPKEGHNLRIHLGQALRVSILVFRNSETKNKSDINVVRKGQEMMELSRTKNVPQDLLDEFLGQIVVLVDKRGDFFFLAGHLFVDGLHPKQYNTLYNTLQTRFISIPKT